MTTRLKSQIEFLNEVEKLKIVYRQNKTVDRSRNENSAEHSWHIALMSLILAEHADQTDLDLFKVVKMLLIHDLPEIHAGDTWIYDTEASQTQPERECDGARRLFSLLPPDQRESLQALRREFEERATPEARFAAAVDALQPLTNYLLSGTPDGSPTIPERSQVLARKKHIESISKVLWRFAQTIIDEGTSRGLYS